MKRRLVVEDPEELEFLKNFYRLLFEKEPNHDLLKFAKLRIGGFTFTSIYAKRFVNDNDTSSTQGYVRYISALESALRE